MSFGRTPLLESLESRTHLSVSTGANGFDVFGKSSDTRVIYVSSSSGNDKNSGMSASSPVKTLGKAESLMRDGKPDWMLLKDGDTFNGGFPEWKTSGESASAPQVIGDYGSGNRPIINSGTKEGFVTFGGTGHPINYLAITGLQFKANTYNGRNGSFDTTGIRLTRQGSYITIQDCVVQDYAENITLDADGSGLNHVSIIGNEVLDAYATSSVGNGHAQGIFLGAKTQNTLIKGNVLDHNGYNTSVSGAGFSEFCHDIYEFSGVSGTVIEGNIISRPSLYGCKLLSPTTVENNVFIDCPAAISLNSGSNTVSGNLILNGIDLAGTSGGAVGVEVNKVSSASISNNLIADDLSTKKYHNAGIRLNPGAHSVTVTSNTIYKYGNVVDDAANISYKSSGTITSPKGKGVSDTIGTFGSSVGVGNSFNSWIAAERSESEASWKSSLASANMISFFKKAFGV
jgi:hypothetical protein